MLFPDEDEISYGLKAILKKNTFFTTWIFFTTLTIFIFLQTTVKDKKL